MSADVDFLYDEFSVSVADIEFVFFADSGFINRGTYISEEHSHEYNEIIYCFKGATEITYGGDRQALEEGDVVIIPSKTPHFLTADDDTCYIAMSFWKGEKWDSVKIFKSFPASDAFRRILEYYYGSYGHKKELINACIYEIITMMLEMSELGDTEKTVTLENNSYRRYIIEQYIQSNYKASPSVAELAKLLHLSVPQTQRIIKKLYNRTFSQRILMLRMSKAKSLILETDLPIADIAAAVGYNNAHNFFAAFKKETGMTPKEYRKTKL